MWFSAAAHTEVGFLLFSLTHHRYWKPPDEMRTSSCYRLSDSSCSEFPLTDVYSSVRQKHLLHIQPFTRIRMRCECGNVVASHSLSYIVLCGGLNARGCCDGIRPGAESSHRYHAEVPPWSAVLSQHHNFTQLLFLFIKYVNHNCYRRRVQYLL